MSGKDNQYPALRVSAEYAAFLEWEKTDDGRKAVRCAEDRLLTSALRMAFAAGYSIGVRSLNKGKDDERQG